MAAAAQVHDHRTQPSHLCFLLLTVSSISHLRKANIRTPFVGDKAPAPAVSRSAIYGKWQNILIPETRAGAGSRCVRRVS